MSLDKLNESLKNFTKVLSEAGEPDQDYDHAYYQAICDAFNEAGFECKHKEFDKYQGVFIEVKGQDAEGKPCSTEIWHGQHPDTFVVDGKEIHYLDEGDIPDLMDAIEAMGIYPSNNRRKNMHAIKKTMKNLGKNNAKVLPMKSEEEEETKEDGGIGEDEIEKQKEKIIDILANALVVGMSQVEEMLGENFKDSKQAEAFIIKMLRHIQTSDRSNLRQVLRRFDRMGSSFIRQYRRGLA